MQNVSFKSDRSSVTGVSFVYVRVNIHQIFAHFTNIQNGEIFSEFWYINPNQIVLTIFRLIWNQTESHLVQNQSEDGKYDLIPIDFKKSEKKFVCNIFSLVLDT